MSSLPEYGQLQPYILELEAEGLVTRTFRRLDPERQTAVIQAILEEATERGPAQLNIKSAARRAGVAVGSMYQYFPNREGLLDFVVELCVRFMTDAFQAYRAELAALPLREGLRWYLLGGLEWSATQSGLVQIFARAAYVGHPELAERLVRPVATLMREIVGDILKAAQRRGEIRPEVDPEAAARLVHALTIAVGDSLLLPYLNNYFQVTGEGASPEQTLETMLALLERGLGPPGDG